MSPDSIRALDPILNIKSGLVQAKDALEFVGACLGREVKVITAADCRDIQPILMKILGSSNAPEQSKEPLM